jgi:flagellar biosynthesis/type III secretory pathway chaperone
MAVRTDEELGQRVAALRRFRELLVQQRAKFENYLKVLDHERSDIESGDVDRLAAHVEIEEAIVSEIFTFQKVIDPLERIYRAAYPAAAEDPDLPELRGTLEELKVEVLRRNAENRALLKRKMETVRSEIAGFRNPLSARSSVYARQGEGALVDIQG